MKKSKNKFKVGDSVYYMGNSYVVKESDEDCVLLENDEYTVYAGVKSPGYKMIKLIQ